MADLLRDQATDVTGTGVALTGPCTVQVENNSVFDGAQIEIQSSVNDVSAEYSPIGYTFTGPGSIDVTIRGAYYLRAILVKANTTGNKATSVSCEATQ